MSLTPMESAMDKIVTTYQKYASHTAGPDGGTLDKKAFKKLVEEQFPNWLKNSLDPKGISDFFKELDTDKDKVINFEEFTALLAEIAILCNEKFTERRG